MSRQPTSSFDSLLTNKKSDNVLYYNIFYHNLLYIMFLVTIVLFIYYFIFIL